MYEAFLDMDFDKIYEEPSSALMAKAFLNRLYRKLHVLNFSLLIAFFGKHRTGKSMSAVSLCFLLDKTFEECMETRIVYTSKQFLDAVRVIREKRIKGAGIIFDEAGSSDLASQKWYEEASRVMSAELQAIGYLNPLICFVTQNFSFINTHARKLSQGVFEVERTNNLYTTIRPFWVESSPWTSGYFHRYPIFCEMRHGVASNIYKANRLKLHLPPAEIRDRYEAHAQAFKDQLLEQSREGIEQVELQKERSKSNLNLVNETVAHVITAPDQFMSGYNLKRGVKTVDINLLRHFFKISYSDARMVKVLAERKLGNK